MEVVSWNASYNHAELWTCLNLSSIVDTVFYLYFDNDQLPNIDYIGVQNSVIGAKVWDSNFVLVDHMQDYEDVSHTVDSTVNNNDGTKEAANQPLQTLNGIGYSQSFNKTIFDDITVTDNNSLNPEGNSLTVECFINTVVDSDNYRETFLAKVGASVDYYHLRYDTTEAARWTIYDHSESAVVDITGTTDLSTGEWFHITAIRDVEAGFIRLYVNGVEDKAVVADTTLSLATTGGLLYVGGDREIASRWITSNIDEIRVSISSSCREPAYIKATYHTLIGNLLTENSIESYSSPDLSSIEVLGVALMLIVAFTTIPIALIYKRKK